MTALEELGEIVAHNYIEEIRAAAQKVSEALAELDRKSEIALGCQSTQVLSRSLTKLSTSSSCLEPV